MRRASALAVSVLVFFGSAVGLAVAEPVAPPPAGQQQNISAVIARALAQRGVAYVYGGGDSRGPTGNPAGSGVVGFDASGLMVYAFAGAGIKLPRSSKEQYQAGRKIWPAQALPGDLVFYGPDGSESVAMFLGNGQILEATEPRVTVSRARTANMAPYLVRIIG